MSRVVVITGASAGVGRATARAFAAEGARVGLIARGTDGLDATAKEVRVAGGTALALPLDVSDPTEVDAAAASIEEQLGAIDVWVNNAMTSVFAPFWDVTAEEFARVTAVAYHGYVNGTRAALRHMRPRDRGVIVQVGSALGYRGIPLQSAYCGAKHAIQGFTESVRCELYHEGSRIRIGIVQLPALNTPQFDWVLSRLPNRAQPVPPIFQPEVAAAAVVRVAEHPRREMWVGWPTIRAIVLDKLVPGLADLYLAREGVAAQQTSEPADPSRPANLWEPVPGDHGARGSFDDRARPASHMAWLSMRRPTLDSMRTALARSMATRRGTRPAPRTSAR